MVDLNKKISMNQMMGASYIDVDIYLIRAIGYKLSVFISVLLNHNSYFSRMSDEDLETEIDEFGWMCMPVEYICDQLFIGILTFDDILKDLIDKDIISTIKKGYPAVYWYKINSETINKLTLDTEIKRQEFLQKRGLYGTECTK